MEALVVSYLIWAVVWGAVCAWLAGEKGRDQLGWFVSGFFLAPVALIALAASPSKLPQQVVVMTTPNAERGATDHSSAPSVKTCPMCAEAIRRDAKICRFCRYELTEADEAAISAIVALEPAPPPRWRVARSSLGDVVGTEATLGVADGDLLVSASYMKVPLPLHDIGIRIDANALYLTAPGGFSIQLVPLDGQDIGRSVETLFSAA
jgi:hypothetical protein